MDIKYENTGFSVFQHSYHKLRSKLQYPVYVTQSLVEQSNSS